MFYGRHESEKPIASQTKVRPILGAVSAVFFAALCTAPAAEGTPGRSGDPSCEGPGNYDVRILNKSGHFSFVKLRRIDCENMALTVESSCVTARASTPLKNELEFPFDAMCEDTCSSTKVKIGSTCGRHGRKGIATVSCGSKVPNIGAIPMTVRIDDEEDSPDIQRCPTYHLGIMVASASGRDAIVSEDSYGFRIPVHRFGSLKRFSLELDATVQEVEQVTPMDNSDPITDVIMNQAIQTSSRSSETASQSADHITLDLNLIYRKPLGRWNLLLVAGAGWSFVTDLSEGGESVDLGINDSEDFAPSLGAGLEYSTGHWSAQARYLWRPNGNALGGEDFTELQLGLGFRF